MPKTIKPVVIVFLACVIFTIARFAIFQKWTAFVDYDGYYSYYIARWGLDADKIAPFMDVQGASYRYQRIVYPLTAFALSLGGNALLAPFFLVMLNIVAITVGTYTVSLILADMGTSHWYSLVYGLYGSQFLGLMTSLTEPMTYFFVALAIYLWTQKKSSQSVVVFAIAGLTKEVALLFVFAFIAHYVLERKWTMVARMGLAIVPYVLWQLVLFVWLGKPGFSSGQPFEFPLWGWLSGFVERPGTSLLLGIALVPMSYAPMLLLGANASINFLARRNWHPYVVMVLLHVGFMLVLPGATAREPAAMLRITQGLVLATLLYGSLLKSSRISNYSILWIGTLAILVKGSGNTVILPD